MDKKLLCIVFAAVLAMGIVGCASASSSGSDFSPSAPPTSASGASANVGIPNPWSDAASAAEAAQGAGLNGFSVPSDGVTLTVGQVGDLTFSCMDGMAQARATAGDTEITIRKAVYAGDGDISGDYNVYEVEWLLTLEGVSVNCAGHSQNAANKALWVVGDYAYCILAQGEGLSPDDVNSLINAIQ